MLRREDWLAAHQVGTSAPVCGKPDRTISNGHGRRSEYGAVRFAKQAGILCSGASKLRGELRKNVVDILGDDTHGGGRPEGNDHSNQGIFNQILT